MYWDVTEVVSETHLTLFVRFSDGLSGRIRFLPSHLVGVFAPLKKPDFFIKVFIHDGVVTWPDNIDLAPDAMHNEIKTHGEWVLK